MSDATGDVAGSKGFRFDTSAVEWKKFLTDGCYYRIIDVNVPARTPIH